MTMSENAGPAARAAKVDKGLKANAIGFLDALVIGLNSTSPAYSLAAVIGPIVALAGILRARRYMLASFVPMLG